MRAAARHGGENQLDRFGPVFLLGLFIIGLHFAHIIGIANGDIAGPAIDFAHLRAVIARRLGGEIGFQAAQPIFELGLAQMREHGGK